MLASQGDFAAHAAMLRGLGAEAIEVRTPEALAGLDALVIPGGESTTITKAIERDGLEPAIRAHVEAGRPLLGTCAGMIVCDREHLGLVDVSCRRNAFGRQIASFEADLRARRDRPRAAAGGVHPRPVGRAASGDGVEVLAEVDGHPVAVARRPGPRCARFIPSSPRTRGCTRC